MSAIEHYERRRLDFMAAWFPGDPNHVPEVRLCPCGSPLGVVKDATGTEWFACESEWPEIERSSAP